VRRGPGRNPASGKHLVPGTDVTAKAVYAYNPPGTKVARSFTKYRASDVYHTGDLLTLHAVTHARTMRKRGKIRRAA